MLIFYISLNIKPGACFSKVPKLFGRIPGDIILFVSSKRRRLEARNFAVIFTFIPFTSYEKTSFTNRQVVDLRVAFRVREVLGTFEKRAPGTRFSKVPRTFRARKAIRKTTTRLFCKAGLFICCKGNKNKNNCKVSCLETPSF